MLKQLQTLGCDTKDTRASIEITDAPPWSPKLGTFLRAVWRLVSSLWAKRLAASWRLTIPPPRMAAC